MKDRVIYCEACNGTGKIDAPPEGRRIGLSLARTMKPGTCGVCGGAGKITVEIEETEDRIARGEDVLAPAGQAAQKRKARA